MSKELIETPHARAEGRSSKMKVTISLTVNGTRVQRDVEPRTSLADFLREELRLTATHLGCEHGVCGACTVMIDGAPARACIALAVALDGSEIRTVEGFASDAAMTTIKEAFHQEHGLQCGFCTPGMVLLGGKGTLLGPVIGPIIVVLLEEYLRDFKDLRFSIFGLVIIVVVLFLPQGLMMSG